MSINLGSIRRHANKHIHDDAFVAPSTGEGDWRNHVPESIRLAWSQMGESERVGVLVLATELAGAQREG